MRLHLNTIQPNLPNTLQKLYKLVSQVAVNIYQLDLKHFITLMDSLKLNMMAVDQIHPFLSDLMQSLNKVTILPADFEGKIKIKQWFVLF